MPSHRLAPRTLLNTVLPSVLFSLVFALAWRFLFWEGKIPINSNVMQECYPNWMLTHTQLRGWHIPLWNALKDMGEPYWADPKSMAAYPVSWFLAFLAPTFLSFMRGWVLLHTVLAAYFSYKLATQWSRCESAGWGAALLMSFNGFFMVHAVYPNLYAAAAFLPAVLYFYQAGSWKGLGITLALQWLAGYPPFTLLTLLALVVMTAGLQKGAFTLLAKGCCLALGLSALQIVPFLEYMYYSSRNVILDASTASVFSISWHVLLKELCLPQWIWVTPHIESDPVVTNFYVGSVAVLLAVWGVIRGGRRERWLGGAAVAAFGLCLGQSLPGYSYLGILHVFRFPATWLFPATAATAFLTASGLALIPSKRFQWALVGMLTLDLLVFAQCPTVAWFTPDFLSQRPPWADAFRTPKPSRVYFTDEAIDLSLKSSMVTREDYERVRNALIPSLGTAYGVHEVRSYQVLRLKRAKDYQDRLHYEGPGSPLLRWAGISTLVTPHRGTVRSDDQSLAILKQKDFNEPLFIAENGISFKITPQAYEPGHVRAVVFVEKPAKLVFSEVAYPGWQVFIDDHPIPHKLFENTFLAVDVPSGAHWVEFAYRPNSFKVGGLLSVLTVLGLMVL